jgi:N-acetylmuramoyl-L-alanine amidase
VLALQKRLSALGYWLGTPDGTFGNLTEQAVYALQKAAGLQRDGIVGAKTRQALDDGVRPAARNLAGNVIQIDLKRQLLMFTTDGKATWILNTSTGGGYTYTSSGETRQAVTPAGSYSVFRQVEGWDTSPLGQLWRPKYFNGGIALHGYGSVPPYAASHGCVRVSIDAMNWIWDDGMAPIGQRVVVF